MQAVYHRAGTAPRAARSVPDLLGRPLRHEPANGEAGRWARLATAKKFYAQPNSVNAWRSVLTMPQASGIST